MSPFVESLVVLGFILTVSRFIKRGSHILQRYFIPSALVAGIVGLIFGPQVLRTIPGEITGYWATFPKYLISVVFAGLFLGKTIPHRKDIWRLSGPMLSFGNTLAWGQYVIGIGLTSLILTPIFKTNSLAGSLIEISFEGGHGSAAGLAPTFAKLGWAQGTDIALTLATISLIMSILIGVFLINLRNRKHGYLIDENVWKEQRRVLIRSGYNLVRFGQKMNTNPKSIFLNILAFVISITLGLGLFSSMKFTEEILLSNFTSLRFIPFIPLFPFVMIGGLILQLLLRKIKKQHLIQRHTVQVISTIALDVLIASAIATVSLSTIKENIAVVTILSLAGLAWILGCFIFLAPRMFPKYWFENGITNTGQSMGMTAIGLLMNRLSDPTNESKAKEAFAYKQLAFEPFMGGGLVTATAAVVIAEFGSGFAFISAFIFMTFWMILGLILGGRKSENSS